MSNNDIIRTDETEKEYLKRCEHDRECAENDIDGYTDWSFYDKMEEWN